MRESCCLRFVKRTKGSAKECVWESVSFLKLVALSPVYSLLILFSTWLESKKVCWGNLPGNEWIQGSYSELGRTRACYTVFFGSWLFAYITKRESVKQYIEITRQPLLLLSQVFIYCTLHYGSVILPFDLVLSTKSNSTTKRRGPFSFLSINQASMCTPPLFRLVSFLHVCLTLDHLLLGSKNTRRLSLKVKKRHSSGNRQARLIDTCVCVSVCLLRTVSSQQIVMVIGEWPQDEIGQSPLVIGGRKKQITRMLGVIRLKKLGQCFFSCPWSFTTKYFFSPIVLLPRLFWPFEEGHVNTHRRSTFFLNSTLLNQQGKATSLPARCHQTLYSKVLLSSYFKTANIQPNK